MKSETCPRCNGSKQISRWCGTQTRLITCPSCKGKGIVSDSSELSKKSNQ